ncbi:MAG: hypothetical protein Q9227_007070 [Pyrenula ochraceoflavens]
MADSDASDSENGSSMHSDGFENEDDSASHDRSENSESGSNESGDWDEQIKERIANILADVQISDRENTVTSTRPQAQPSFATVLGVDETSLSRGHLVAQPFMFNPGLQIVGLEGIVGLPLQEKEAVMIARLAHSSPFGKGEQTIVDTSVRNSVELNSDQFSFSNPRWSIFLEQVIVPRTLQGLGFDRNESTDNVVVEPYKLLLYDKGAFFHPHRDSEKTPGMFATLVVNLPSGHRGGEVVLKHKEQTLQFATGGEQNQWEGLKFAAWYADVQHEVKPVMEGRRLVVTYNLIRRPKKSTVNLFPEPGQQLTELKSALYQWSHKGLPKALAYQLSHQYTEASLSFDGLKGNDRAAVRLLRQACFEEGFQLCLAMLERIVYREPDWYYPDAEDEDDDDSRDCELSLSTIMCGYDGQSREEKIASRMGFRRDWLVQDNIYESREPDSESEEGYTGNEGASKTCRYRDTVSRLLQFSGARLRG